jgi:hypothetical protein
MRAEKALVLALLSALAATLPAGAAAVGADVAPPTPDVGRTVEMNVQLLASGDANWTVSTHVHLNGSDDREAFETLGRQYVNGTADLQVDAELFRRYAAAARAASGRSMRIPRASVERNWVVHEDEGVLVLRFTWRQFARNEGDRLVVDDAFETSGGTWLPRLERGQKLVVRPPEGVGFVETPRGKGVTNGTLQWEGPVTFGEDYFRIVYRTDEDQPSPTTTTAATTARSPTTTVPPSDSSPPGALVLVALLGGGGAAAYLWLRREGGGAPAPTDDGPVDGVATDGSDATVDDAGGAQPSAGGAADDPVGAQPSAEGTDDAEVADDEPTGPTPEDPFAGVDVEMLSDEERVLRLLDANGGRMKQAQIVKETDWSNAKVSQLLSRMDDDDAIDKLRIGRENLISVPDVDVDSFEE